MSSTLQEVNGGALYCGVDAVEKLTKVFSSAPQNTLMVFDEGSGISRPDKGCLVSCWSTHRSDGIVEAIKVARVGRALDLVGFGSPPFIFHFLWAG